MFIYLYCFRVQNRQSDAQSKLQQVCLIGHIYNILYFFLFVCLSEHIWLCSCPMIHLKNWQQIFMMK